MNGRRIVTNPLGGRATKVHCRSCHRVEAIPDSQFPRGRKSRQRSVWMLAEHRDGNHFCSWRCFQRPALQLIRDPLPIPTPVTGSYEFALGFWACMQGYGALSQHDDYQRGYREAMELRARYYTRPGKR